MGSPQEEGSRGDDGQDRVLAEEPGLDLLCRGAPRQGLALLPGVGVAQ